MYRLVHASGLLLAATIVVVTLAAQPQQSATAPRPDASQARVLLFSKTAGFRHDSIPAGIAAITALGKENNFTVDASEDANMFTSENLRKYRVVIFLNTTGDILNDEQQSAFERYIREGGGFVGVHAATDTEYDWPWYTKLVGAQFASHPEIQSATIHVIDREHASTRHLPAKWTRSDEWYNFRESPSKRENVRILARIDEAAYDGGAMKSDHPVAWCREFDGGRA